MPGESIGGRRQHESNAIRWTRRFALTSKNTIRMAGSRNSDPNAFFDTNVLFGHQCVGNTYCESMLSELGYPEWTINPGLR